jgi:hypothetical protein
MFKGLSLPLVIIFIAFFLLMPIGFYFYFVKDASQDVGTVKGVTSDVAIKPGVNITISSKGGAWDLHQFLCDTREACLKSLTIGKPWGVVSGGVTKAYNFNIDPTQNWGSEFKYMKVFVKSSWGSMIRVFEVSSNKPEPLDLVTINSESVDYNVVLIPLENITNDASIILEFSDY